MAKYRRTPWQRIAFAAAILALVLWRVYWDQSVDFRPEGAPPRSRGHAPTARTEGGSADGAARRGGLPPGEYRVERVVDGDTLMLTTRQGSARVRLQGVDSPETVKEDSPVEKWGPEAAAYTRRFVQDARGQVAVEVDGEPRDQYDRFLAFIWADGRMLNEELVRAGLARAKLGYDYSQAKKDRLRRAQLDAQRAARGIWSAPQ